MSRLDECIESGGGGGKPPGKVPSCAELSMVVLGVDSDVSEEAGLVSEMEVVMGVFKGGLVVLFEVVLALEIGLELLLGEESLLPPWEFCCLHLARRFLNQTYNVKERKKYRVLAWP